MPTLSPGTYRIRYRLTGVFELLAVRTGDIAEALAKTLRELGTFEKVGVNSYNFDRSDMIVIIYLKVVEPSGLNDWNRAFITHFNQTISWFYHNIQRVSIKFLDYKKVSGRQAEEEIKAPSPIVEGAKGYVFKLVIAAVGVYALASNIGGILDGKKQR